MDEILNIIFMNITLPWFNTSTRFFEEITSNIMDMILPSHVL